MTYTLTAYPNIILRDVDQAHIPTDEDNIDYQEHLAWVEAGNTPNPHVPPTPTKRQEADAWLAGGLTVNFTSGAAPLSGRYAVTPPHSDKINAIATSMAYDGNALPGGGTSVTLSDMDGNVHPFDKNSFKLLMRAIRDFVYYTDLYVMGEADALPPNVTSKSIDELDQAAPT